ncbi:hypothetical protein Pint_21785 [Pistacia integerrima]|uniref:Uncharacterized protein n=1 Tax=Pistacia integerrima TaxID=434235 RepID=A0ACC0X918_9ROSI|nr:hypothetical protein Pint_21785 [Pistacia integerrima]
MVVHLNLHIIILLVWAIKASAIHCPTSCGNVSEIRYPFGIGEGSYFNEWFAVTCDNSSGSPVPFFSKTKLKLAEDISRRSNGMAIGLSAYLNISEGFNVSGTPFSFSHKLNKFISTFQGLNCKSAVMVEQDWLKTSYLANTNPNVLNEREHVPVVMEFGRYMGSCAPTENNDESGCTGNLFCNITGHNDCSTCPHGYTLNSSRNGDDKPMCDQVSTLSGSPGGPSNTSGIPGGAVGLSSAILSSVIGTLSISIGAQRLYEFVKRWIANKLKQKFFKKNGGLLLQRRKSSNVGNIQNLEFFTENELEKATDSYNENRILDRGGQGTVYKGMLEKGRIVVVKKLKQVAKRVDVFNEKMEQNRLFEILDTRVSKDDKEQEIIKFADLTRRCLDSNGSNKPTMRRVATELAGIRIIDDSGDPPREYPIIHESKIKSLQMKIEKEEDDTAFQVE